MPSTTSRIKKIILQEKQTFEPENLIYVALRYIIMELRQSKSLSMSFAGQNVNLLLHLSAFSRAIYLYRRIKVNSISSLRWCRRRIDKSSLFYSPERFPRFILAIFSFFAFLLGKTSISYENFVIAWQSHFCSELMVLWLILEQPSVA